MCVGFLIVRNITSSLTIFHCCLCSAANFYTRQSPKTRWACGGSRSAVCAPKIKKEHRNIFDTQTDNSSWWRWFKGWTAFIWMWRTSTCWDALDSVHAWKQRTAGRVNTHTWSVKIQIEKAYIYSQQNIFTLSGLTASALQWAVTEASTCSLCSPS